MTPERERELLEALRAGNPSAAAELYRLHRRAALGFAVHEVRDLHRAEDIVSDAFTRTLAALRSGAGPRENVALYLRTAIRRLAWTSSRERARVVFVGDIEAYAPETAEPGHHARTVSDAEAEVAEAFRLLRPRHQLVLALRVLLSFGNRRSASVLGLTPAAEAQLYRRARLALRARLSSSPAPDRVSSSGTRVPDERSRDERRTARRGEADDQRQLPDAGRTPSSGPRRLPRVGRPGA